MQATLREPNLLLLADRWLRTLGDDEVSAICRDARGLWRGRAWVRGAGAATLEVLVMIPMHRYLEALAVGQAPRPTREELFTFLMSPRAIVREDAMIFLSSWVAPCATTLVGYNSG